MRQLARGSLLLVLALGLAPVRPALAADLALCNAPNRQVFPKIFSDGAGGAIVTWEDNRSGNYDVYAQHVLASGAVDPAWTANGTLLCSAPGDQINLAIVSDGAGGAIVAWQDRLNTVDYDIYAQHLLASGVVDPAWPANGSFLGGGLNDQINPAIVSDGAGGAIVTWQGNHNDGNNPDIYAQHVLASGAVAWTYYYGNLVCNAGSDQINPAIVSDGAGGAIITWKDSRSEPQYETGTEIYAQHVLASGEVNAAWTPNGIKVCDVSSGLHTIISDGAGGAIVTWMHSGPNNALRAQHVLTSGVMDPGWAANGVILCTAASVRSEPAIISDDAGGAIVTWTDHRSGFSDIYAQHMLASGETDPAWTANGTLLCNAANAQGNPTIVSDGAGGAIVTWQDRRGGTEYDIYAQHVLASGVVDAAWTANGTLLCNAVNDQRDPMIVSNGAGGALVTWFDYRDGSFDSNDSHYGNWDVYATLLPGEVLNAPPGNVPEGLALSPARPNPMRNGAEFRFALPREGRVSLTVFDQQGRRVRELVSGVMPAGNNVARWDGRDRAGRMVPSGLYFVRLEADGRTLNQRFAAIQ